MPFVIDARMKRYHQLSFLIAAALLLAFGVAIVFFRRHALAPPPPSRPQSIPPVVVDIKPVSPKATSVAEADHFVVSSAIAAICGADPATADRYDIDQSRSSRGARRRAEARCAKFVFANRIGSLVCFYRQLL